MTCTSSQHVIGHIGDEIAAFPGDRPGDPRWRTRGIEIRHFVADRPLPIDFLQVNIFRRPAQ
jgi:hypothetical protein